jgi:hypothetical protein
MQYRSAQWEDLMKTKTYLTFFLIIIASLASVFIPQAALPAGGGMMGGPSGGTIGGGSPIHEAAKLGDLEKVQTLLKNNPELVSSKADFGRASGAFACLATELFFQSRSGRFIGSYCGV